MVPITAVMSVRYDTLLNHLLIHYLYIFHMVEYTVVNPLKP